MFADEAGTSSAPASRDRDRRRARDAAVFASRLGDVIGDAHCGGRAASSVLWTATAPSTIAAPTVGF